MAPKYQNDVDRFIEAHHLSEMIKVLPPTQKIEEVYEGADAIFLPSFYEGLPNTVCEGMACGKPILMSAVCDAGSLAVEGQNGYLFDPRDHESIADAIWRIASLTSMETEMMGARSREMAEALFDHRKVADRYELILDAASNGARLEIDHWPAQVPETALLPQDSCTDDAGTLTGDLGDD